MQGPNGFKQALLEKLLVGLRERGVASSGSCKMSFYERKSGIRRAADAALASARGAAPRWSRTLQRAAAASTTTTTDQLAQTTTRGAGRRSSASVPLSSKKMKMMIFERQRQRKAGGAAKKACACSLARAMARRKRTGLLRAIVPGGEGMDDEHTLLGETLDYTVCLRAQVDVMQLLVRALQAPKS